MYIYIYIYMWQTGTRPERWTSRIADLRTGATLKNSRISMDVERSVPRRQRRRRRRGGGGGGGSGGAVQRGRSASEMLNPDQLQLL